MHSKRPKFFKFSRGAYLPTSYNLAPLARLVHSPPTPEILPPTQIPIENPAFSPSNQHFVYNFYSGVNFCRKKFAVILFCRNLFLRIAKKTAKNAKIRTCKNLVPDSM